MWSTFWLAAELATMESRRTQSDLMEPTFPIRVKTQSMLGVAQKAWFLRALLASSATWKLWGNSVGVLDWRLDFQHLPTGFRAKLARLRLCHVRRWFDLWLRKAT